MQNSREVERAACPSVDHLEALIDEAGAESFPASDPPAVHLEPSPIATNVATDIATGITPSSITR